MTHLKKGFLPALAVAVVIGATSFTVQAQLAPSAAGFEGSPARDAGDSGVLSNDFRQQRSADREQYRGALTDLMAADRLENEQEAAAAAQARQDAIQQQVQDTLAQPSDYGTRLEALKRPPPTGMVNPDGTPYTPSAGTTSPGANPQPLPTPTARNPIAPVGRNPGGIAPAIQ